MYSTVYEFYKTEKLKAESILKLANCKKRMPAITIGNVCVNRYTIGTP